LKIIGHVIQSPEINTLAAIPTAASKATNKHKHKHEENHVLRSIVNLARVAPED